ncbi:hypothetical protein L1S32_08225 [Methanogenium sp. S4BF]|uniref:hypothetical protein n=1 Tax=Methanogenium sp. S4BF TaxID=1789226 RepID=UPI002417A227|nr:hypothetical protein [Methanogenium sp. S4BF]WFN33827.1 hypothetical protein L1S32_08225 [Methanogenium sp. S4BF]
MISASSPAFILVFLVFMQGLTTAVLGGILYAALSLMPARGWVKAGAALGCAFAGAVIFAAMGNVTGMGPATIFGGIFLTVAGPLIILSPIFILAERPEYTPYAGIMTVIAALFCAAATGGLIQALNITAFLGAGSPMFPPAILYLFSFGIMGGIHIVLGAEFFIFACLVRQGREEKRGNKAGE